MRPALRSVLRSESPAWPLELSSHRARRTALESFGTAGCNLACKFCIHPDTLIATTQGMRRIADLFESCGKKISHEAGQVGFPASLKVWTRLASQALVAKVFAHPKSASGHQVGHAGSTAALSQSLTGKANNVGHCITLSVRSMAARDSFFLRVSIGSGAILAPLLPARNPTSPPN
jgi:hypothetical protein